MEEVGGSLCLEIRWGGQGKWPGDVTSAVRGKEEMEVWFLCTCIWLLFTIAGNGTTGGTGHCPCL